MKVRFRSKAGVSLVEEICAVMVLVVAVAALAGGIGLSRGAVSRGNTQDAAAAKAQDLADTLVAVLSARTERAAGDVLEDGSAEYRPSGDFSDSGAEKQYSYEYVEETDARPAGYKIRVSVSYGKGRAVTMTAYAADTGGAFAHAAS